MRIEIPDFCLVLLIGATGSGKSTFARAHFKATEIVSSEHYRGVVDDDENSPDAGADAIEVCRTVTAARLKRRKLTVIDAPNVRAEDRAEFVSIAMQHHARVIGIVIDPGERVCLARNGARSDRRFGPHVVRNQMTSLRRSLHSHDTEGIRDLHRLESVADIAAASIVRKPTWTDARDITGPFDIIGDVHGCADELQELLAKLGYVVAWPTGFNRRGVSVTPPAGRRAIFLGDLVDRGPNTPDCLRIVMSMVEAGSALCVMGNHDAKFARWLAGKTVTLTHGLDRSVAQMDEAELSEPGFKQDVAAFLAKRVSHYWLDGGRLAVAHAGVTQAMIGRASGAVREFCLYGETTGEVDDFGAPVRRNWAAAYRGKTTVVYGHTPTLNAEWLNGTICIDTGAVFGGYLTALRWPERQLVDVASRRVHAEPKRPFVPPPAPQPTALQAHDDIPSIDIVAGRHTVATTLGRAVTLTAAQSAIALEAMSRFAVRPRWLVHLPPTMSPCATTLQEALADSETTRRMAACLEQPAAAFEYYRDEGIGEVVCEEKHMGSRALIVICRDADTARTRFGVATGETGMILTRTGRAFFEDAATCEALLARVRASMTEVRFWQRHATPWALLDCAVTACSTKARDLTTQFALTAATAQAGVSGTPALLAETALRDRQADALAVRLAEHIPRAAKHADAFQRDGKPVGSIDDCRIAPFHVLATEGRVHMDKEHVWHMSECARLCEPGERVLAATRHRVVDLSDDASTRAAADWWLALADAGGEGMVVKPRQFVGHGRKGIVQPALKVRGPDDLRMIYGPDYDMPDILAHLRGRSLGLKRSLAYREFILGHEALTRFIAMQPLRTVHEAVFAILALESEPVDPRL